MRDLWYDYFDSPRNESIDQIPALIGRCYPCPPIRLAQRTGIQQNEFSHCLVAALENGTMGTKFIDRSHPFLIRRIIRIVGHFRDFTQSQPRRGEAFLAILICLRTELAVWS
jgi:hypothetical protein